MTISAVGTTYPVNENGAVLLEQDTGSSTKTGDLNEAFITQNPVTNKMLVKFPVDIPTINTNNVLVNGDGVQTPVARAVSPIQFLKARKALANVKSNAGNMKIAMIGDSTMRGRGAIVDLVYTSARPASEPSQLAKYLSTYGIVAKDNSMFGTGVFASTQADYIAYDSRISGSGWVPTGSNCMGGPVWTATSSATFTFTPTDQLTTYDIYYIDVNNGATWSWDFGSTATNVVGNGTASGIGSKMKKVTITNPGGAATTPLNIKWVSGQVYLFGIVGYNTATAEISVVNMGGDGWGASNWAGSVFPDFSTTLSLKLFAPDLTIIRPGINDWQASKDVIAFTTSLQTVITAAKISGDVIICPSPYAKIGTATLASMNTFIEAMRQLSVTNNCGFFDHSKRWDTEANMALLGFMNSDDVHIKAVGLSDLATADLNLITSM